MTSWLNTHLMEVESRGPFIAPLDLAARAAADDRRAYITYVPLHAGRGTLGRASASSRAMTKALATLHDIGYNQIFMDPVTGRRCWQT